LKKYYLTLETRKLKRKRKKEKKERNPDCRYSEKTYSLEEALCVRFQLPLKLTKIAQVINSDT
jgi:hypothetical protein